MPRAWFPIVLTILALDMMTPRAWGWRSHPAVAPVTPTVAPTTAPAAPVSETSDTSESFAAKPSHTDPR